MTEPKLDSRKTELLTKWYLRLNGYFTVENFIVHAGDDLSKISNGVVGNHTEVDTLAIRHKYSRETYIANDPALIETPAAEADFIIGETKTGNEDRPNKVWREKNIDVIQYILRFSGLFAPGKKLDTATSGLANNHRYNDPRRKTSVRLLLFSQKEPNKEWRNIHWVSIDHIIDFFVRIRGKSWISANIGVASIHYQWDGLINDIFEIANMVSVDPEIQKKQIADLLVR